MSRPHLDCTGTSFGAEVGWSCMTHDVAGATYTAAAGIVRMGQTGGVFVV